MSSYIRILEFVSSKNKLKSKNKKFGLTLLIGHQLFQVEWESQINCDMYINKVHISKWSIVELISFDKIKTALKIDNLNQRFFKGYLVQANSS